MEHILLNNLGSKQSGNEMASLCNLTKWIFLSKNSMKNVARTLVPGIS